MKIKNENPKSNLKIENKNRNQDWNFDNVIWWIRNSGLALEAIHALTVYTYGEMKELKECKADKLVKEEIKMDNKEILSLFSLIEKYCDSVNCDCCIIKDICKNTNVEIGIPHHWVEAIKERIESNEQEKNKKNRGNNENICNS